MPFPEPPSKIVQFRAGSAAPYDIERQFDEHTRAFRTLVSFLRGIIRDDGMLLNGKVGPEQLTPDIGDLITQKATDALDALLISIRAETQLASAGVLEMTSLLERIREREHTISTVASNMQQVLHETRERLEELRSLSVAPAGRASPGVPGTLDDPFAPEPTLGILGPPYTSTASGMPASHGVDPLSASAIAADYAQVSMEWAEHMPDTIPPNILAINSITGDHWSSRWWANRAAAIFGGDIVWLYLGAYPTTEAPAVTPTGEPLTAGMVYFDTTKNEMMVWNGTFWQSLGDPQPAIVTSFFYKATANQTAFPTTANDILGNSLALKVGQGVAVYLNGVRLTPDDGTGTKGDYTVSIPSSTVTLGNGAPANSIVAIDALALPSQLAPSVAKIHKLKPFIPAFDGTTTVFTMQSVDGTTVNITTSEQLVYSLDGVTQEPYTAFTANGATITFAVAPSADAYGFGIWMSPT